MTFEEVYEKLDDFIHWLSHNKANGAVLMDHDEISGELYVELVKGFQYYEDLPEGELLAVLRRMMDNRIAELIHRYYNTHRGLGNNALSIHDLEEDYDADQWCYQHDYQFATSDETDIIDPLDYIESVERVRSVIDSVSDEARTVLSAVLTGNDLLGEQLTLSGIRASFVYQKGGTVKVKPYHVALSLAMDEKEVKDIFKEIKEAYVEVCSV